MPSLGSPSNLAPTWRVLHATKDKKRSCCKSRVEAELPQTHKDASIDCCGVMLVSRDGLSKKLSSTVKKSSSQKDETKTKLMQSVSVVSVSPPTPPIPYAPRAPLGHRGTSQQCGGVRNTTQHNTTQCLVVCGAHISTNIFFCDQM